MARGKQAGQTKVVLHKMGKPDRAFKIPRQLVANLAVIIDIAAVRFRQPFANSNTPRP
jgi:hypothetical protein